MEDLSFRISVVLPSVQRPIFQVNIRDRDTRRVHANVFLVPLMSTLRKYLFTLWCSGSSLRAVLVDLFQKQPETVVNACSIQVLECIYLESDQFFYSCFYRSAVSTLTETALSILCYRQIRSNQSKKKTLKQFPRRSHFMCL